MAVPWTVRVVGIVCTKATDRTLAGIWNGFRSRLAGSPEQKWHERQEKKERDRAEHDPGGDAYRQAHGQPEYGGECPGSHHEW